ncbi:MAG: hypothetical protein CMN25_17260 [Salinicola sp.]|uniref:hypothetical protein n=1 Tax=uncultured Salinicola sp. TaxID=1193542 RepID=UPI000C8DFABD|nr:hypothetical protein [uncultured Salinicola sp.]MAM59064.1 hypothetical protein [Salinicola sp.]
MGKRLEDANCLTESECLLIDPRADRETLLDHAEMRLDAVKDLMFTLSTMNGQDRDLTSVDLSNLATVSRYLTGDASDLLVAARRLDAEQRVAQRQAVHRAHGAGGGHV